MASWKVMGRDGPQDLDSLLARGASLDERVTPFRILVADGDKIRARMTRGAVSNMGFIVDVSNTSIDAEKLLKMYRYDLVLADAFLPDMGGLSFLAEVRMRQPGVPVVITSGDFPVELASRVSRFGAADMLKTPFDRSELEMVLNRALGLSPIKDDEEF
ncbi:MAG: response regulator [Deltaproteobacteria bacterium]|nr:response regulator [Deltaproteobacteria bacterium]